MERHHGAQGGRGSERCGASPSVQIADQLARGDLQLQGRDDFAPSFVRENIRDWLGYEPRRYLEDADFWRRCVHPDHLAAVEAESVHLFKKGRHTVEYLFLKKDGSFGE